MTPEERAETITGALIAEFSLRIGLASRDLMVVGIRNQILAAIVEERERCILDVCECCQLKKPLRWWDHSAEPFWAHYDLHTGANISSCRANAIRSRKP